MMTRLVLVGLVAALGVTLPSRPDCDRWIASTQKWASRVLADWDTWEPHESDAYSIRGTRQVILTDQQMPNQVKRKELAGASPEVSAAASSKSSTPQQNAAVPVLATNEKMTRNVPSKAKDAGWNPVVFSDHTELAVVVELYRIAEETSIELRREPVHIDVSPVSGPPVVQVVPMQALPSRDVAPDRHRNEIESANALSLPADVFAPESTQSEAQSVTIQSLPTDVFAPAERGSEVLIAEFRALPDDVFVPTAKESLHTNDHINPDELLSERVAMISQRTAPVVEPIGDVRMAPQPWDDDFDCYCKAVSPLSPDSEQFPTDAVDLVTGSSSQRDVSSIEPGPDVQPGNADLPSWTTEELDAHRSAPR